MELEKIKKELESNNYLTYIRNIDKSDKYIFSGIAEKETLMKPNFSFNIFIVENKIKLNYFEGHLLKEHFFDETKLLLEFVKKKFPIN